MKLQGIPEAEPSRPDVARAPERLAMAELRGDWVERLVSVQRAARAVTDSAAEWWRRLADGADTVVTSETLDAFYHQALGAMQAVLGADEVSILAADPQEEALVARTSIGLGEKTTVKLRIPAGEGMAGRVLASRQPLVVDDLGAITLVSPVLKEQGLRSVVAVPIMNDQRVLGVLHAGSRSTSHFTASDAELLGFLADRLAVAVDRVRLFEEQRRLAEVSNFLAQTARIMSGAADLKATLEALAAAAVPTLGDLCLIDMVGERGIQRLVARHGDRSKQRLTDRLRDEFSPTVDGDHPAAEVLRLGVSRWAPSMSDAFLRATTHNEEHYRLTQALGFRSYLAVPILAGNRILGALTMVSCSRPLGPDEVALAEGLALQVGTVISKAQQLEQASLTSRLLQSALLPADLPEIAGLSIEARYSAASQALDVGGDFYDVLEVPDGRVWFAVGDVEGHDRRAAAVMGQLRSAVRVMAVQGLDPDSVISELRLSWRYLGGDRTATVLVGRIDPQGGHVALASAGHLPPLRVSADGAEYVPVEPAPLLGVDGRRRDVTALTLERDELLLLYTDGALRERTMGLDDGMALLRRTVLGAGTDPSEICDRVIETMQGTEDDIALLSVMRVG